MRLNTLAIGYETARRRPLLVSGEFVIGGTPLPKMIERCAGRKFDQVSPIGWMPRDFLNSWAKRLRGIEPPSLPSGRNELLICPECGNLGCGFISCEVSRKGDLIIWSELGYESFGNSDNFTRFEMGNFRFSLENLDRIFAL